MSTGSPPEPTSGVEASDLPMSTTLTMLGVEMKIHPEAMHNEVYNGRHRGGLDGDVEFRAWQGESYTFLPSVRRELAFWARRNLFGGAPTDD